MIEEEQQKSRTGTSVHLSDLAPEGAELFGRDGRNSENPKTFRVLQDATRQKHVQKSSTTTTCHLLPSWADCSSPEGQEGRQWGRHTSRSNRRALIWGSVTPGPQVLSPCCIRSSITVCGDALPEDAVTC